MFGYSGTSAEITLPDSFIGSIADAILGNQEVKDKLNYALAQYLEKHIENRIREVEDNIRVRIENKIEDSVKKLQEQRSSIKKSIKDDLFKESLQMVKEQASKIVITDMKKKVKKDLSDDLSGLKAELMDYFLDDLKKDLAGRKPLTFLAVNTFKPHDIPIELSMIESVFEYDCESEHAVFQPGIYFLYKNNYLQYIGQAVNIANRIQWHLKEKDIDRIFFIPVPECDLDHVETHLINKYRPPLNKSYGPSKYKDLTNIPTILKACGS